MKYNKLCETLGDISLLIREYSPNKNCEIFILFSGEKTKNNEMCFRYQMSVM